jgi:hypothetical protein
LKRNARSPGDRDTDAALRRRAAGAAAARAAAIYRCFFTPDSKRLPDALALSSERISCRNEWCRVVVRNMVLEAACVRMAFCSRVRVRRRELAMLRTQKKAITSSARAG